MIASEMLCIYYLVGVNHFAKFRKSLPVAMRNAKKSIISYSAMVREVEK